MAVREPIQASSPRDPRSDSEPTRERLLLAALRLFSQQGYARTSVRAIAQEAGANVAAIAYHFGDKAALYTATFYEPLGSSQEPIAYFSEPGIALETALQRYFESYLEPLRHDDLMRQSLRLHMRELLDPTHVWPELIERECRTPHMALLRLLCQHLGGKLAADTDHAGQQAQLSTAAAYQRQHVVLLAHQAL